MKNRQPGEVRQRYRGVVVPMVTPVKASGDLDEPAVRRVVDHLLDGGVDGVFVLGTTGEAASVPDDVRSRLVAVALEHVGDRATVYAGIGGNCLSRSVAAAEKYLDLGVDAVVAHLPSYYALQSAEQRAYYLNLAERIPGPLILYNIPITTHMSIDLEVVEELSEHPKIVGIKDSENEPGRLAELIERLGGQPDFALLVGVSALSAWSLGRGVDGIVPSTANLAPGTCSMLYRSALKGDATAAENCQRDVDGLNAAYADRPLATSLAALKFAMSLEGLCAPDVLPPLRTLSASEQNEVSSALDAWRKRTKIAAGL
jgi:4-hydroxy-tetrahydrodipicolinate synthase